MIRVWGPLLAVAVFALSACGPTQPVEVNGVRIISAAEADTLLTGHVDALNAFRATAGLQPVRLSAPLTAAARTHARDMSVQERAWHFGSDGTSPRDRADRAGFAGRVTGENISESYDDEVEVFQSWLNDPVTRAVMLTRGADSVGFGWYQEDDGKLWWVQVMGQTGPLLAETLPPEFTPG